MPSIGANLGRELIERIDGICRETGLTRSEILRRAAEAYLANIEAGGWRRLARECWQEASAATAPELEVAEAMAETVRVRLQELRAREAELQGEKAELTDRMLSAHQGLDPGSLAQIRKRMGEVDQELAAIREVATEAERRLTELQKQYEGILKKRSDTFRALYEPRLFAYLRARIEQAALPLLALYADVFGGITVTRNLRQSPGGWAIDGWRQLGKWLDLHLKNVLRNIAGDTHQDLRLMLEKAPLNSDRFQDWNHIAQLVSSDFSPRFVREDPTEGGNLPDEGIGLE